MLTHAPISDALVRNFFVFLGGLAGFGFYALSEAVTLYAAFNAMRGRPFRLTEAFARGFARFFPILGVSILFGIVVGFGVVLLLVPGLMWGARYYVALPACVMEALGPAQSMNRSAELTKGYRWRIFGVYLVVALVTGAPEGAISVLFTSAAGSVAGLTVTLVWHVLVAAYSSITVAVMYHDLRVLKDGIDIEQIAAVFD
jgi:hypothetical protein